MLKKILKWTAIVLGSLLALLLVFFAIVYFNTEARINKVYAVSLQKIAIPADTASYAAGKHIAENRGCIGCHGADLSGGRAFQDEASPIGLLYAANITRGRGGIDFADEDWIRVLRHGLGKDNKSVWFMPSHEIYHISNEQMGQLISFVKSFPPVDKTIPAHALKPLGRMLTFFNQFPLLPAEMIDHKLVFKDKITPSVTAAYGAYLATVCRGCHGEQMKGGPGHGPGQPPIANISATGHPGEWTAEQFTTTLRTGKTPEGKTLDANAMPWKYFTFTDDELEAIHLYLQTMK